jgi:hypothetical protein
MFFRREKINNPTFSERLDQLKGLGFSIASQASGTALVSRGRCAATIEDRGASSPVHVNKAGVLIGNDIGLLVHGGFQMFWQTPGGKVEPALASQLKGLHAFEEDLKEGLGLVSLYNESLGTTCDQHMYDRIVNRDAGVPSRPWDKP